MPDLMTTFKFALEVGGLHLGTFKSADGVGSQTEIIEYKEMTQEGKLIFRKVPGVTKWKEITLARRLDSARDLWEWRKKVEDGDIDGARRDGSIVVKDSQNNEVARWNFTAGWPSEWNGAELDAGGSDVATESVTITHEGLVRA
jgi:phage tail-like protein